MMADLRPLHRALAIDLGKEPEFDLGGMRVKPAELAVAMNDERRELQPRVMQVLVTLAHARPSVVSRDKLVELCWGGRIVGDDAINRCVLALRHLAQEFTPQPFTIETVPRVGHRLIGCGAAEELPPQHARRNRWRLLAGAAAGFLLVLGATVFLSRSDRWPWQTGERTPKVLVSAAASDAVSQQLAHDLAVKLASLQQVQSKPVELISQADDEGSAKPDLILQVGTADSGSVGASVTLTAVRYHSVLWSKQLEQPSRRLPDLKQQIAVTAAHVLRCAAEGLASGEPLSDATFKLYLSACDAIGDNIDDPRSTVRMLERVVQSSPRFVDGWARLLLAETAVVSGMTFVEKNALVPSLKRDMVLARKLEPELAEAYIAEYFLMPQLDFVGRGRLLDRAIAHNPEHAELRVERSYFLQSMGRIHDALIDAHEAVKLDPLSPPVRECYIEILAMVGRVDAAQQQLRAVEQLWPSSRSVEDIRLIFHMRWGDPREALRLHLAETSPQQTWRMHESFLRARIDPTPANIEAAVRHGRMVFRGRPGAIQIYSQLLAEFDRKEELFEILLNWQRRDLIGRISDVLFRPAFADVHRDRRFIRVAERLGLLNYWRTTGEWPDFCYAADLPYDCKAEAAKIAR